LRAGALSHPAVARLLKQEFTRAWQKKGTLTILTTKSRKKFLKLGGNVISYICTPDGRVIHAIPYAPGHAIYRKELLRALKMHKTRTVKQTHLRLGQRKDLRWMRKIHQYLASHALARIETIEQEVFSQIVRQKYAPDAPIVHSVLPRLPNRSG